MTTWTRFASYCRDCGRAFRVSPDALRSVGLDREGEVSLDEVAAALVSCVGCITGEPLAGEIIEPREVAGKFSEVLRQWLRPWKLQKVVERNRNQRDPHSCHSHDFCDANMAMVEALASFGLASACDDFGQGSFAIWNQAWDIAKTAEFDPVKAREGSKT